MAEPGHKKELNSLQTLQRSQSEGKAGGGSGKMGPTEAL